MALVRSETLRLQLGEQDWRSLKGDIGERFAFQAVLHLLKTGPSVGGAHSVRGTKRWHLNTILERRPRHERWHFEKGSLSLERAVPTQHVIKGLKERCDSLLKLDPRTRYARAMLDRLKNVDDTTVLARLHVAVKEGRDLAEAPPEERSAAPRTPLRTLYAALKRLPPDERRLLLWWQNTLGFNLYSALEQLGDTRRPRVTEIVPDLRYRNLKSVLDTHSFLDAQTTLLQGSLGVLQTTRPDYVVFEYDNGVLSHVYFFEVKAGSAQPNANQKRAATRASQHDHLTYLLLYIPLDWLPLPREYDIHVYGEAARGEGEPAMRGVSVQRRRPRPPSAHDARS